MICDTVYVISTVANVIIVVLWILCLPHVSEVVMKTTLVLCIFVMVLALVFASGTLFLCQYISDVE